MTPEERVCFPIDSTNHVTYRPLVESTEGFDTMGHEFV